jgi:hypothetical protein
MESVGTPNFYAARAGKTEKGKGTQRKLLFSRTTAATAADAAHSPEKFAITSY